MVTLRQYHTRKLNLKGWGGGGGGEGDAWVGGEREVMKKEGGSDGESEGGERDIYVGGGEGG